MHKNLPTVEGLKTRFLCSIIADEGTNTTLAGYVKVGGESLPMTADGENELVAPATPAGDYLYELRAGGSVVMWGNLCARPSAFPPMAEYTDIELSAEINAGTAIQVEAELRSGPRGEKGERGEEGSRGYSAYEIACQEGFVGTEAEWLEAMRQETATLAVQQVTPLTERAENAATKAGASETQAEKYSADATSKAEEAHGYASTAGKSAGKAVDAASTADAARAGAQDAQRDAEKAAEDANQKAKQAEQSATAARNSAGEATASAASAEASKKVATTAATNAAGSATAAAESASAAEKSAALLGDAALKSANNVFSGANVFNGALSGNGTLFGVPMARWMGLSSIFSQVDLKASEFKTFFPEWQKAEVWPYVRLRNIGGDEIAMGNTPTTGTRFAFFEVNATKENWHEPWVAGVCEEMWVFVKGNPWVIDYLVRGLRNYIIAPDWVGDYYISLWISDVNSDGKPILTTIYAPKQKILKLHTQYYHTKSTTHAITLACTPSPIKNIYINGGASFRFLNANFSNCTLVNVASPVHVEKDSILAILNTLPTYDAATMTTVPTCTFYVDPEYEGDEDVINAFLNLQTAVEEGGKGWTVAVSGISLTGAATYRLRPTVYCKRWPESSGLYVDADGVRWDVSSGTVVLRHGEANEQLGYEAFASVEDALEAWGLEAYVPEERGQTME